MSGSTSLTTGSVELLRMDSVEGGGGYQDISGFCKSATLDDICSHGYVVTPGRYVGTEEVEDDGELFEEKVARLTVQLTEQF